MANTVPVRLLMAGKLLFEFNKSVRKMDPASILKIERQLVCVNCAMPSGEHEASWVKCRCLLDQDCISFQAFQADENQRRLCWRDLSCFVQLNVAKSGCPLPACCLNQENLNLNNLRCLGCRRADNC